MSLFKRKQFDCAENYGLTEREIWELGDYNARTSQGVVHTPEYQERMAELQARFDAARNIIESNRDAGGSDVR